MVLFTRPIAREGAIWLPPGKPMRTYPFDVKFIQGVESVNSSAKIQFQVNRSIFVGEMNHLFSLVMLSLACIFAVSERNVWHYSRIRMFRTYMAVRCCDVNKYCVM